ncbi:hypothetical protein [Nocardia asiatica]|uniref:hypothetical protein n=1 Tax=Nocardia asiatica TaxID=209252 RepID=UPI00030EA2FF|nr:hypothetical protein [Nocardia asiatica]
MSESQGGGIARYQETARPAHAPQQQTGARAPGSDPKVFAASRVLLGVIAAGYFVVFDSNDPYGLSGVAVLVATPDPDDEYDLNDTLSSGRPYHGAEAVVEARRGRGGALEDFIISGTPSQMNAVGMALPHFARATNDQELLTALDAIARQLETSR